MQYLPPCRSCQQATVTQISQPTLNSLFRVTPLRRRRTPQPLRKPTKPRCAIDGPTCLIDGCELIFQDYKEAIDMAVDVLERMLDVGEPTIVSNYLDRLRSKVS